MFSKTIPAAYLKITLVESKVGQGAQTNYRICNKDTHGRLILHDLGAGSKALTKKQRYLACFTKKGELLYILYISNFFLCVIIAIHILFLVKIINLKAK